MDSQKLQKAIEQWIQENEKLGDHAGGSGNMGFTSYILDSIEPPVELLVESPGMFHVKFHYRIIVETEFTYYPDNPPYEYPKMGEINVDKDGLPITNENSRVS